MASDEETNQRVQQMIAKLQAVIVRTTLLFELDENSIWIRDARDLYFFVVSAWDLLKTLLSSSQHEDIVGQTERTYQFIELAKDKYAQVQSELETFLAPDAERLTMELKEVFSQLLSELSESLLPFLEKLHHTSIEDTIEKMSPTSYLLHCAVCGAVAVSFEANLREDDDSLYYSGIICRITFDLASHRGVFALLETRSLRDVHDYLRYKTSLEDGIDAYCPKCDKIYCKFHYHTEIIYDEGFYDCTYGVCPEGRRRIIDD